MWRVYPLSAVVAWCLLRCCAGDGLAPRRLAAESKLHSVKYYEDAAASLRAVIKHAKRAASERFPGIEDIPPFENGTGTRDVSRASHVSSAEAEEEVRFVLLVKFLDEAKVRAHGTEVDAVGECKGMIDQVLRKFADKHVELHSVFEGVGSELDELLARAEGAVGQHEPDLRGITRIDVPGGDVNIVHAVGQALEESACVEYTSVEFSAPPAPCYYARCTADRKVQCAGDTPNFRHLQTYRGLDPGIEADWALSQGADGEGVRYADVEYGLNFQHEDLPHVAAPSGNADPRSLATHGTDHGTATVSIAVGQDNSYGVLGLAPKAEAAFFPEWVEGGVWNRVKAMGDAAAHSRPGDVILMEMQVWANHEPSMPAQYQWLFAPAEFDRAMWDVVKVAVDAGIVVVAGAGNGYPDTGYTESYSLDGEKYGLPTWRARGDSGAIIVGAGSDNRDHEKLGYSGYGSRVDVQAWGRHVAAAGAYNTCGYIGSENREYCTGYSGTSSASAIVGAAAAQLQSLAKKEGKMLTSRGMRELLTATGTPQGGGNVDQQIGPQINLRAAIERLRAGTATTTAAPAETTTGECSEVAQDCQDTKCCATDGYHCYEKNEYWAGCKVSCFPGIDDKDPEEHRTPWTCRVLGNCADTGEDCSETQCCSDMSHTCFRKNDHWAGCKATCVPGIDPHDHPDHSTPWSCDILGTSAPQHVLGWDKRYLTAEASGTVAGDRDAADTWEQWEIVQNEDGTVSLRSFWDLWLAAEPNGEIKADRGKLDDWEKFTMTHHDDGRVSFRSFHGGYLCMEPHGRVKADRDAPDDWEKFSLTPATGAAATKAIDRLDAALPRTAHLFLDRRPLPESSALVPVALAAFGASLVGVAALAARWSLRTGAAADLVEDGVRLLREEQQL